MSPTYHSPSVDTIPEPPEGPVASASEEQARHRGAADERPEQSPAREDDAGRDRFTDTGQYHRQPKPTIHHLTARPRSVGSRRTSVQATVGSPRSKSAHYQRRHTLTERREPSPAGLSDSDSNNTEVERVRSHGPRAPPRPPPRPQQRPSGQSLLSLSQDMTEGATATADSGSSSGSGSTITQASYTQREHGGRAEHDAVRLALRDSDAHPDALSFLDPDSPAVTAESIKRSLVEASAWRSPDGQGPTTSRAAQSASASSSSGSRGFGGDASSPSNTVETERSTSPEHGDSTTKPASVDQPRASGAAQSSERRRQGPAYRYGTPEMPRGNADLPHLPASALTPRVPNQGHVKHLPRAEKLPLSGYELLADRLSLSSRGHSRRSSAASAFTWRRGSIGSNGVRGGSSSGGEPAPPRLKPIYRRFEALNHRLLLHLQDELSELEEQLHRLDTADTQNRRVQNRILPASRRAEFQAGGELQWHRTDILGKIGFKLAQYNHVLSSFTSTRDLPSPSPSDVDRYRAYLARESPIVEIETRFLDGAEDLVTLALPTPASSSSSSSGSASASELEDLLARPEYYQALADDALAPMPGAGGGRPPPSSSCQPSPTPSSGGGRSVFSRPRTANTTQATTSSESSPAARRATKGQAGGTAGPAEADEQQQRAAGAVALGPLLHVAVAAAVAVLVPILAFAAVPSFAGRMAVVLLVAASLLGSLMQSGSLAATPAGSSGSREAVLCAGLYGVVMAVVAAVVG